MIRNCKLSKHSKYAPEEGNRYDGIYKVIPASTGSLQAVSGDNPASEINCSLITAAAGQILASERPVWFPRLAV